MQPHGSDFFYCSLSYTSPFFCTPIPCFSRNYCSSPQVRETIRYPKHYRCLSPPVTYLPIASLCQLASTLRPLREYFALSRITVGRKADHDPLRLRAASAFFSALDRLSTSLILLIVLASLRVSYENLYQKSQNYSINIVRRTRQKHKR